MTLLPGAGGRRNEDRSAMTAAAAATAAASAAAFVSAMQEASSAGEGGQQHQQQFIGPPYTAQSATATSSSSRIAPQGAHIPLTATAVAAAAAYAHPNQRPVGVGGGEAASMLMAVNALAHTPTQSVSDALLSQVHEGVAEDRRNSLGTARSSFDSDVLGSAGFGRIAIDSSRRSSASASQSRRPSIPHTGPPSNLAAGDDSGLTYTLRAAAQIGIVQTSSTVGVTTEPFSVGATPLQHSSYAHSHSPSGDATVRQTSAAGATPFSGANVHRRRPSQPSVSMNIDEWARGDGPSDAATNWALGSRRRSAADGRRAAYLASSSASDRAAGVAATHRIGNAGGQPSAFLQGKRDATTSLQGSSASTSQSWSLPSPTLPPSPRTSYRDTINAQTAMLMAPQSAVRAWEQQQQHQSAAAASPHSQARMQVGNIAASVAVYESIAQATASTLNSMMERQHNRKYDPNEPLDGVPSTPMMPTPTPAMLLPPTPFATSGGGASFVPFYRLAPDEYQILASAAAVATAALTTVKTSGISADLGNARSEDSGYTRKSETEGLQHSLDNDEDEINAGQPARALTEAEQDEIAAMLRAWAGLEGSERQQEARQQLHDRQGMLQTLGAESGMQVVPPDFARHFQSQLTALAAGYYNKLHSDALAQSHYAPAEPLNAQQQQEQQRRRREEVRRQDGTALSPPPTSRTHAIDDAHLLQQQEQQKSARISLSSTNRIAPRSAASPSTGGGGAQVDTLISQASAMSGLAVESPQIRDQLLQYAHQLYATGNKQAKQAQTDKSDGDKSNPDQQQQQARGDLHPTLLPLLHTLHTLHPQHLPTLLLLSCAYYSCGDLAASLWYNKMILSVDAHYVESMSNIGTTLRALGRWHEAESWWWRAVRLRPSYWDAYENLLGVLCSPQQIPPNEQEHAAARRVAESGQLPDSNGLLLSSDRKPETTTPRFREALRLCEFVEASVLSKQQQTSDDGRLRKIPGAGAVATFDSAPVFLPSHLPFIQVPRLQSLFYAKGNLKFVLPELGAVPAAREYEKAIEVVLSSSEETAYSVRDLVFATYVIGVLTMGITLPGAHATHAAAEIASVIGVDLQDARHVQLAAAGQYHLLCPSGGGGGGGGGGGVLRLVRTAGDRLLATLLRLGGGAQLPLLMMLPYLSVQLAHILFADVDGFGLPALARAGRAANMTTAAVQGPMQQAQTMTSTVLLTLAKLMQDATTRAVVGPHGTLTLGGVPPSTSLLLPLYYLSVTFSQTASTANNLGILLSTIPVSTSVATSTGERQQMNGQSLALQYYTYGLQLDPKHPHLYTNFGSLLKDLNHLAESIQMYEKAIECNPTFDVALANLGNAIKDQGRTRDSVQYYRRAVQANADFPEALCGLVNSLLAICDWEEVYADDDEGRGGLMGRVVQLLERQLDEGGLYGAGAMCKERTAEQWADAMVRASGRTDDAAYRQRCTERIQLLAQLAPSGGEREKNKINEGSFLIRLVERITRRTQRQWYVDTYGVTEASSMAMDAIEVTATAPQVVQRYARITLPSCLGTPGVPTVLPFHTFTLKIPPRAIRLISHRTALRISQTTMTQLWLPPHVYAPPPPPSPRLRVGYLSSDFNNHPLAHLMQSTFGFHDRERFEVVLYALTPSDQSPYRQKIEREAEHFVDVSTWTAQAIIARILADGIHVLMNLNGYTKGARNEVMAARPCPVQMQFMGFAGGMASGWTDWIVVDPIVCPQEMTSTDVWRAEHGHQGLSAAPPRQARITDFDGDRDPEAPDNDWVYTEKFIYMPDSYFVNDHKQGFREPDERRGADGTTVRPHEMSAEALWREEELRRWRSRKDMWPALPDDYVIFADFNQLYKLEPTLFKLWLRILARVPKSILWLLRFPAAGEAHLLRYARRHFGEAVAARIVFTDVAPKGVHILRGRIADLFLDTLECGAHTTSADILWSGTPVLTWPKHKHKMASRVAASIVAATGYGDEMIVDSEQAYEDRAVQLAESIAYTYVDAHGDALPSYRLPAAHTSVDGSALRVNVKSTSSRTSDATASAPAPANAKHAASESAKTNGDAAAAAAAGHEPLPQRDAIALAAADGPQAPPTAVSRRAHGRLAELRKALFLSRDANRLFDTRRWVRHLERGYEEAWRRWVRGIDTEDSAEWRALPSDDPVKQSGHIWVQSEED